MLTPVTIPYRAFPITASIHEDRESRIRVVCLGRQSGKSYFSLAEGFCMSVDAYQRGDASPRGIIVAPTNKMLRENWAMAEAMLASVITRTQQTDHRLELGPLGAIEFISTESQGGAGRGGNFTWAVLDEASRIPQSAWESDLRPALAVRRARVLIPSTPNGLNWFYDIYTKGCEGLDGVRSWHATTLDCWRSRFAHDPTRLADMEAEFALIRRTTSEEKFRQEYLAEFLSGEGQLFHLKPALYRGVLRDAVPGRHYLAGVDVARKEDWMVTAVIEVESQQLVGLVRSRHQDWSLQKAVCLNLLRRYPSPLTQVDSTGVGDPIADDLRRAGVNVMDVVFTPNRKSELVENLLMAIDQCYLGVPEQAETRWLIEELQQYQCVRHPSGTLRYGAPEGRHDDGVTALMLAAWGLQGQWQTPPDERPAAAPWWEQEGSDWERIAYEERVREFARRFPLHRLPVHPTDLAWTLMTGRN